MKRNRSSKRSKPEVKLWSYPEALRALPYVDSVLRSIREHLLETNRLRGDLQRRADKPGRPNRGEIIADNELRRQADLAQDQFQEAVDELQALSVVCSDPLQGEVIFPFIHEEQVAWFTHSLFEGPHLRWWRYDSDGPETLRPILQDMKVEARMTA